MTVAEVPITSSARIAERIAFLNHRAKRCTPVVGNAQYPTPWTLLHAEIDQALAEWEASTDGRAAAPHA